MTYDKTLSTCENICLRVKTIVCPSYVDKYFQTWTNFFTCGQIFIILGRPSAGRDLRSTDIAEAVTFHKNLRDLHQIWTLHILEVIFHKNLGNLHQIWTLHTASGQKFPDDRPFMLRFKGFLT